MTAATPGPRPGDGDLYTPAEVALMFRVTPVTVTRWDKSGKLESIRTPGQHRRFPGEQVRALLRGDGQ